MMTRDHQPATSNQKSTKFPASINSQSASTTNQQNTNSHHNSRHHHHSNHKIVPFDPFCLLSDDDGSIKRAAEFVENALLSRFKICVVSIVSKDSLDDSAKNKLLQALTSNSNADSNSGNSTRRQRQNRGKYSTNDQHQSKTDNDVSSQAAAAVTTDDISANNDFDSQVIGHVDTKADVIVLNLTSFSDTDKLIALSETVQKLFENDDNRSRDDTTESKFSPLSSVWPNWNQNLIKTLLIMLIMSHIVVFYNPEPSMDYNLVQLFKILETLRLKSQTRITDLLETIASKQMFPQLWIRQGRVACPRALFVCDTTYSNVDISLSDLASIKRDLEDQIYKILKKANIINRPAHGHLSSHGPQATTLFSLPERDDFVFVLTKQGTQNSQSRQDRSNSDINRNQAQVSRDEKEEFYMKLFKSLELMRESFTSHADANQISRDTQAETPQDEDQNDLSQDVDIEAKESQSVATKTSKSFCKTNLTTQQSRFRKFLFKHISEVQALGQQVEQETSNKSHLVGKLASSSLLLPRYDDFFTVLLRLKNLLFPKSDLNEPQEPERIGSAKILSQPGNRWSLPDERRFIDIYDLNNSDELFSKLHCHKTRLAAFDYYTRDLRVQSCVPPMTELVHQQILDSAKGLYLNHARGPACQYNLDLLVEQCQSFWQNFRSNLRLGTEETGREGRFSRGHRQLSKTMSDSPSMVSGSNGPIKAGLSITRRSNGVKVMSCCDCGRQSNFMITPIDRKKKLERVDVHRIND